MKLMAITLKVSGGAHQIPLGDIATNPSHLKVLETWMRDYQAREAFR